jgi:hypothetical protein
MDKFKRFIKKVRFTALCLALLLLFLLIKTWDFKFGDGPGIGPINIDSQNDNQDLETLQPQNLQEQKSNENVAQSPSDPPKVAKLYLGRQGVSDNQTAWYDIDEFADFIKQLKDNGIREVQYTLLPDSIERYEKKWAEELGKANMRGYIETDGVSFLP